MKLFSSLLRFHHHHRIFNLCLYVVCVRFFTCRIQFVCLSAKLKQTIQTCEKLPTQRYNHSHLNQRVKDYPSSYAEPNLAIFVLQQRDDPSHQRNRRVVLECHASPSLNLEEETKLGKTDEVDDGSMQITLYPL